MPEKRDESFSRENHLRKSSDFQRIFKRGKRTATRSFVLYSLPNHLPYSRLGVQVKAKIGTAVRRNYMKRIVREAFRKMKKDLREPLDLIFIAEKAMCEIEYYQLESELRKALERYLP